MAMTDRELGQALRDLRIQAGVTQVLMARWCHYEQPHVSRIECGLAPVTLPALRGYARAAGRQAVVTLLARALDTTSRAS